MSKHDGVERFYVRGGEVYTYPASDNRWADEVAEYLFECEERGMGRDLALRMEVLG